MSDEDDLPDEDLAVLAALSENDTPPTQAQLAAALGDQKSIPISRSHRGEEGGAPVDRSPDDIAPVIHILTGTAPGEEDRGFHQVVTLRGLTRNDPDLLAAFRKRADDLAGPPQQRDRAMLDAYQEVAAVKAAKRAGRTPPRSDPAATKVSAGERPTSAVSTPASPPAVGVRIDLGPTLGYLSVAYHDVVISDGALVLVADPPRPDAFGWVPPEPTDPPHPIDLWVDGLDVPLRAFPMGLSYPYGGRVHYVLAIERPADQ